MNWLIIVFIGLASNIDNFAVGLNYGIRGKRISTAANVLIAAIGFFMSFVALLAGQTLGTALPDAFTTLCGGLIIIAIGVWSLADSLRSHPAAPVPDADTVDRDANNIIAFNEAFVLGIALSVNAAGTSFGAGVSRLSPLDVASLVAIFSFVTIACGQLCGLCGIGSRFGKASEYAAALLLIAIGCLSIFFPEL
ncbi:MAG: manganese efflux pump [Sporolactobacillus sp.]